MRFPYTKAHANARSVQSALHVMIMRTIAVVGGVVVAHVMERAHFHIANSRLRHTSINRNLYLGFRGRLGRRRRRRIRRTCESSPPHVRCARQIGETGCNHTCARIAILWFNEE